MVKYTKITEEQINEMRILKEEGKRNRVISKLVGVSETMVGYYLNPKVRARRKERTRNFNKEVKLNPKKLEKRRAYSRNYNNKKYQENEEFREKMRESNRSYQRRKYWEDKNIQEKKTTERGNKNE